MENTQTSQDVEIILMRAVARQQINRLIHKINSTTNPSLREYYTEMAKKLVEYERRHGFVALPSK